MYKNNKDDIFSHVSYVCADDAPAVKWSSLSSEMKAEFSKKMMNKVSENLSRYINSHPEELETML